VVAAVVQLIPAKGGSRADYCVKARRVLMTPARGVAKRFDLVSYALVFLVVVFAAEAILAALIW
jgi:hypothetical protein